MLPSRPTTIITRGNIPIAPDNSDISASTRIAAYERLLPTMRGQDDYWASRNLSTYKNFSLGYTFKPGEERHQTWPQRYPAAWNEFLVEKFGIGRASVHLFNFTNQPEHPLAGHYWVLAKFSKSKNRGQFRNYGRGFWEVVPGHLFPSAEALMAHINDINPESHFNNDEDKHYKYRLASTGELVVIHNRFGSTAMNQAIREIYAADGTLIPLNKYTANLEDEASLRQLPLMDVWQVDRDYNFTGVKYAHADGRGRVVIHNPFMGGVLTLDSSDYRSPSRSVQTGFVTTQLPAIEGLQDQVPKIGALLLADDVIYATHYYVPKMFNQPATHPGELVAIDRLTLAPVRRVTVGHQPFSIALHQATNHLYVVNYQDGSLSVIDAAQFTIVDTLNIPGSGLIKVAVSQKHHRIYVTQILQKRMVVIDAKTRTLLDPMLNLPVIGEVVVDEATDRLYTLVRNVNDVTKQDLIEFEITAQGQWELRRTTLDGQVSLPSEMAVDANRLYVINKDPQLNPPDNHQKLTVLDRQTLSVIASVPLNSRIANGVATSLSQNVIYVTTANLIQVIDARSFTVLWTIPLEEYRPDEFQPQASVVVDEQTGVAYFGGWGSSTLVRHSLPSVDLGA